MNRSGESVAAALSELSACDPTRDFAVVIDDLDLPFGQLRIRPGGGAGGHRGLASLIEHLGTRELPRLRFGIGRPAPGQDPVEYAACLRDPVNGIPTHAVQHGKLSLEGVFTGSTSKYHCAVSAASLATRKGPRLRINTRGLRKVLDL